LLLLLNVVHLWARQNKQKKAKTKKKKKKKQKKKKKKNQATSLKGTSRNQREIRAGGQRRVIPKIPPINDAQLRTAAIAAGSAPDNYNFLWLMLVLSRPKTTAERKAIVIDGRLTVSSSGWRATW